MNHSARLATILAGIAIAVAMQSVATANPRLLHKRAHGAMGAPVMLPGQMPNSSTATQAVAAQGVTVSSAGVETGAAATSVAGSPGSLAGCQIRPVADGMIVAGVTVDGMPVDLTTVDVGSLPAGTVVYGMPPLGHRGGPNGYHRPMPGAIDTGNVDVGAVDMGGVDVSCIGPAVIDSGMIDPGMIDSGMIDSGMVNIAVISPGFDPGGVDTLPPVAVGPPMLIGEAIPARPMSMPFMGRGAAASNTMQTTSMQTTSAAAVPTTDSAARAMAGGFPNRAVGLRADALGGSRNHGRGVPATAGSVVAVSADDAGGAVVQAGGATAAGDGAVTQATGKPPGGIVRAVGGGHPAGVPGSVAAPRWRDRIRFAWPGAK